MAPVSACRATDGFAVSASVHPTYLERDRTNIKNQIKTRDLNEPHAWGMEGDQHLGALRRLLRCEIVTRSRSWTRLRVLHGHQRALLLLVPRRRALRRGAQPHPNHQHRVSGAEVAPHAIPAAAREGGGA